MNSGGDLKKKIINLHFWNILSEKKSKNLIDNDVEIESIYD